MISKKTLKKQSKSKKDISKLNSFDTKLLIKKMKIKDLYKELSKCLEDKDPEAFKEILWAYLNIHNKAEVAKHMGVSRTTLYRMVSNEGNPTLNSIVSLLEALEQAA